MTRLRDRLTTPVVLLNVLGIALVGAALVPTRVGPGTAVETALAVIALAAWLGWALALPGRARDVALLVGGAAAALGTGLGAPTLIAPVIAALLVVVSDPARPIRVLAAYAAALSVLLVGAAVPRPVAPSDLVSLLAGVAFGVLGGAARRQRRLADEQRDALAASSLAAEQEAQRAQLLEARSAAARDVHDVLAHSLGGLVLQLDAIEALLEHGRVGEAATRATAARRLAAEGLDEARRAVATLRDPAAAAVDVPDDALDRLLRDHRALGSTARTTGGTDLRGVDAAHREALTAALREALVNARRHAPGTTAAVRLERTAHAMVLRVENPLPAAPAPSAGGGHGLLGMRERFAALGDGSSATAGARDGAFVVEAIAVLP